MYILWNIEKKLRFVMESYKEVDLRIEAYTSILVFGGSGAGKSFLAVDIALNRDLIFNKTHEKTIIFHKFQQDCFLKAREVDSSILLINSKEELEKELESSSSTLLVCDDYLSSCMTGKNNDFVTKFFIEGCHHSKISLIWQSQLLFPKYGKQWTVNSSHFILFKSFHESQIQTFFRNFGQDAPFLFEVYNKCTRGKKFGYLFFSVNPKTDDKLRFRNSIIPKEGIEIYEQALEV